MISGLRQGKYKMSLEYLVVLEIKEMLKKFEGLLKGHRSNLKELLVTEVGTT